MSILAASSARSRSASESSGRVMLSTISAVSVDNRGDGGVRVPQGVSQLLVQGGHVGEGVCWAVMIGRTPGEGAGQAVTKDAQNHLVLHLPRAAGDLVGEPPTRVKRQRPGPGCLRDYTRTRRGDHLDGPLVPDPHPGSPTDSAGTPADLRVRIPASGRSPCSRCVGMRGRGRSQSQDSLRAAIADRPHVATSPRARRACTTWPGPVGPTAGGSGSVPSGALLVHGDRFVLWLARVVAAL